LISQNPVHVHKHPFYKIYVVILGSDQLDTHLFYFTIHLL